MEDLWLTTRLYIAAWVEDTGSLATLLVTESLDQFEHEIRVAMTERFGQVKFRRLDLGAALKFYSQPRPTSFAMQLRQSIEHAGKFIFYVNTDQRPAPKEFAKFTLQAGRPVQSLVRQWDGSKERELASSLVRANPGAFRKR